MTTTELPTPRATRSGGCRAGRSSTAPTPRSSRCSTPRPSCGGSRSIILVALRPALRAHRRPAADPRDRLRLRHRRARPQHRHRATPARSRSATRSSSASAPTRRPRSPATPTAGRIGFGITNILVWLPAAGRGRRARRRARGTAGHPAARALPRDRHARAGLHRRAHLPRVERADRRRGRRPGGVRCPSCSATSSTATARLLTSDQKLLPAHAGAAARVRARRPQPRPLAGRPGLRGGPRPRHGGRDDGRSTCPLPRRSPSASRRSTPGAPARCSTR